MTLWAQINVLLLVILFFLSLYCWRVDTYPENRPGGVLTFITIGLPLSGVVLFSNIFLAMYMTLYA